MIQASHSHEIASVSLEQQVIGSMLFDKKVAERAIRSLSSDHFQDPAMATIFNAVEEIVRHNYAMTGDVLERILHERDLLNDIGGHETIVDVMSVAPLSDDIDFQIGRVQEAYRQRLVLTATEWLQYQMLQYGDRATREDFDAILEEFHSKIVSASYGTDADYDNRNVLRRFLESSAASEEKGYHPGFGMLREEIGNIVPGKMYVICAYSGQGKSTLLANLFQRMIENDVPAAVFSTEMGTDFFSRVATVQAMQLGLDVDYRKLERGMPLSEFEQQSYLEAINEMYKHSQWRANWRATLSPNQLLSNMRMYTSEGTKVFIIDHGHRLKYDRANKLEHIAETAIDLRNFAKDKGVAVIVAYQPRKPDIGSDLSKPPTEADIRGLTEIWNELDVVLFPFRPWVRRNGLGRTEIDGKGRPVLLTTARTFNSVPEDERKLDDEHFYIKVGKRRAGGEGGVLFFPFNTKAGAVVETKRRTLPISIPDDPVLQSLDLEEEIGDYPHER
ncbi:MAG: hypothetical protein AMS18_00150 [Gemmatimonas sp. SG8_17]|nr:MAG: hypothetical protein AMS18_00150 [Gemmatimonas sp. SG8_17]